MSTTVQLKYRCASAAVSYTLFSADISLKWNAPPVEKQLKEQPDSRRRHSIHTLMRAHIAKRAAQGEARGAVEQHGTTPLKFRFKTFDLRG